MDGRAGVSTLALIYFKQLTMKTNYFDKIRYLFKDVKWGIKNLITYFPVIWRDRDWDHGYFEDLIRVKFEKWIPVYTTCKMQYEGMEKDIQAMRICLEILKRRKDNWYTETWHICYSSHHKYPKQFFAKMTDEEEVESKRGLEMMHEGEKKDWKLFCRILEKYNDRWWD